MARTLKDSWERYQRNPLGTMLGDMGTGYAALFTPAGLNALYRKTVAKAIPDPGALLSRSWAAAGVDTPVGIRKAPMKKFLNRLGVGLRTDVNTDIGPAFDDMNTTQGGMVYSPIGDGASRQTAEGILGHEAGHAVRHNLRKNRLGRIAKALKNKTYPHAAKVSAYLTALGGFMPTDSLAADAAIAGGGLLYALPQLSEEIGASRVGARLLRLKGLSKLRAFRGVPTYAIQALAPAMAVGVRRGINKLRDSK